MTDLDRMIVEWRTTRSPEVADAIQRATAKPPEVLATLWRAKTTEQGDRALAALDPLPDDPRMTLMFVKCLFAARWPGSGAAPLWTRIMDRLVALRDVRAIGPLRDAAEQPPHFLGIKHTRWIQQRLRETADALVTACEGRTLTVPSQWFVEFSTSAPKGTVGAVWANPDDDATRLVVADALHEEGDPWGEFITIGFKLAAGNGSAELKERAATLLRKHAQAFGGPIAFITRKGTWRFEKGFLVSVVANRSLVQRRRWDEAATAPHWATVRELTIATRKVPRGWVEAVLRNPATAGLRSFKTQGANLTAERAVRGGPWTLTRMSSGLETVPWLEAFLRGLSAEERERVGIADTVDDEARATIATKLAGA
jgi:uncharacterized protein (TIGR02996 family)